MTEMETIRYIKKTLDELERLSEHVGPEELNLLISVSALAAADALQPDSPPLSPAPEAVRMEALGNA
jgi:hypothetical protein